MYTFQHARGINRKNKITYEVKLEREEIKKRKKITWQIENTILLKI